MKFVEYYFSHNNRCIKRFDFLCCFTSYIYALAIAPAVSYTLMYHISEYTVEKVCLLVLFYLVTLQGLCETSLSEVRHVRSPFRPCIVICTGTLSIVLPIVLLYILYQVQILYFTVIYTVFTCHKVGKFWGLSLMYARKRAWEINIYERDMKIFMDRAKVQIVIQKDCSICFLPMEKGNVILSCEHTFHRKCIEKWIKWKDYNSACPLCRTRITF